MIKNFIVREDGFTIQETLVVLIAGSLLVSMAFAVMVFSYRMYNSWESKVELKCTVDHTLQTILMDIRKSRMIMETTDTTVVLEKDIGHVVRYRFDGNSIIRNDVNLTQGKKISISLSFKVRGEGNLFELIIIGRSGVVEYRTSGNSIPAPSSRNLFISAINRP